MSKVFLGGTCAGYKWRNDLIPLLKINYFNPIVKGWSEQHRLNEVKERENADYVLYVITSNMKGVYSIAEVIDDSNKRPEKTIFCVLEQDNIKPFNSQMRNSLHAVEKLVHENGGRICYTIEGIANYLNREENNE